MLLLGALLALLAAGLWMYGLIDVLLTPGPDCRNLRKGAWLAVAGLLSVPGVAAWLWFGRPCPPGGRCWPRPVPGSSWLDGPRYDPIGLGAEAALRRHPAGRARQEDWIDGAARPDVADEFWEEPEDARPAGPDDDPEFLRYLDRVIRDIREAGNGA
jgi:hypothetical protein